MDLILQLCFVGGAFFQTFLMLRGKGLKKRILWLTAVWIIVVGWLYFITRTGSQPAHQPRILIFGVLFWSVMAGISFIKHWVTKPDAGLLILNGLTVAYAFASPNKLFDFMIIALAFTLIIFLITKFLKEESFLNRVIRYILYFGMTITIAVMVFQFGEFYKLIAPNIQITQTWHQMFTGGMFFFYICIHGAILFYMWSLSWGALFTKKDPFQEAKYQYPTSPSVEGVLTELDTKTGKSKTPWIVPILAAALYGGNILFKLIPNNTLIPLTFIFLPEVARLLKRR